MRQTQYDILPGQGKHQVTAITKVGCESLLPCEEQDYFSSFSSSTHHCKKNLSSVRHEDRSSSAAVLKHRLPLVADHVLHDSLKSVVPGGLPAKLKYEPSACGKMVLLVCRQLLTMAS